MNNVVEHTYTLFNNPFTLTQILLSFYKNYKGQANDILLSYLILPLTLHQESCKNIKSSTVRSKILKVVRDKNSMAGLPERVEEYKDITNKCLQYAIDNNFICIDENMQIKVLNNLPITSPDLQPSIIAATKLINIFGSWDVVSIYKLLGIKKL